MRLLSATLQNFRHRYVATLFVQLLDLTYTQLDGLRATIPSIVSPLANSGGNRAAMFAETREVALRSTSRLHTFRDNWSSDETQDLLKKGKESLQNNSDLSKAVDVSKWGWGEDSDEEKWKVPCDTQQLSTEMI